MSSGSEIRIEELTATDAWALLKIKVWDTDVQSALLWKVVNGGNQKHVLRSLEKKLYEGLPDASDLIREINATIMQEAYPRPSELVSLIEQNPTGEQRVRLMDKICQRATTADLALCSKAIFTMQEKVKLAKCALRPRAHDYRPHRAQRFLSKHKDWPSETRMLLLQSLFQGYAPARKAFEVFEKPSRYFPASAPLLPEERKFFLESFFSRHHHTLCFDILGVYNKRDGSIALSREEAKQVIEAAFECIASGDEYFFPNDLQPLWENSEAIDLLTSEQYIQLKTAMKKAA